MNRREILKSGAILSTLIFGGTGVRAEEFSKKLIFAKPDDVFKKWDGWDDGFGSNYLTKILYGEVGSEAVIMGKFSTDVDSGAKCGVIHKHSDYEIIYILSGKVRVGFFDENFNELEGRSRIVGADERVLIEANTLHNVEVIEDSLALAYLPMLDMKNMRCPGDGA